MDSGAESTVCLTGTHEKVIFKYPIRPECSNPVKESGPDPAEPLTDESDECPVCPDRLKKECSEPANVTPEIGAWTFITIPSGYCCHLSGLNDLEKEVCVSETTEKRTEPV